MCHGPLFGKIILFALPLMATYILQLLFNAADLVVIGHYAPHEAMAAIGSTLNLNSLVINLFIGLSIGTNVLTSRYAGAGENDKIARTVHTSMLLAFVGGIILMALALFLAEPLLILMRTPKEILPRACTYIRICFASIPMIMLYNFGCAVLRAVGDTRRPLFFLITAGIINVLLNLFFVICCGMDVEGVALATAVSHTVSALLILRTLIRTRDAYRLIIRDLKIDREIFLDILKIGIPAGFQSSCFAVSNMLIQSSINSFGSYAMAGTTAVIGLEGIVYVCSYAFHQTAISFVSQNLGGQKYKRILHSLYGCFLCGFICSEAMGMLFFYFGREVLGFFNPNEQVIEWGILRMKYMFPFYGICGIMDTASGGLRGLGYSATSTMISFLGACVFRVFWVLVILPDHHSMECLLISYPVSWFLTALIGTSALFLIYHATLRKNCWRKPVFSSLRPGLARGLRYLGGPK